MNKKNIIKKFSKKKYVKKKRGGTRKEFMYQNENLLLNNFKNRVFLLPSNKKMNTDLFKNIREDDLIIIMNRAYWNKHPKIKNHKHKILILRGATDSFSDISPTDNYIKVIFLETGCNKQLVKCKDNKYVTNWCKKKQEQYNNYKQIKEYIPIYNIADKLQLPFIVNPKNNKTLSTGFIAYLYAKNILKFSKNNIILLGFNMDAGFYHDILFEHQYYKDNKVTIMI